MGNDTWRKERNYQIIKKLEKETYKYLEILEADTIKQVKTKEKNYKKSTSGESYSNPNYNVGTLSKE